MDMTRNEMIDFIKENHYVKVSHHLFSDYEYIYSCDNCAVYDEGGYLFEDWFSPNNYSGRNGIRDRVGGQWETGWFIKGELK